MRALAATAALALLGGCAAPAAETKSGGAEKPGYNRRELDSRPGLLTGRDGVWTIYRNDAPAPESPPEEAPKREPTVLLPRDGH
jgi:hypothetical protein